METINEIFSFAKTPEECCRILSNLLKTDDIIAEFDYDGHFNIYINYSINLKQDLEGIIISYRHEYGVGDPYMLFEVEHQVMVAYFTFIEVLSVTPQIDDTGDEPLNEVSVFWELVDLSVDRFKDFLELVSTLDSIFISKYVKNMLPATNSKYYPIVDKVYNNYLNDLTLSDFCLMKEQFTSLRIISVLLGSGFESCTSTLSIFNQYKFTESHNNIDFGLCEIFLYDVLLKNWTPAELRIELQDIIILESPDRLFSVYKTGYSIIEKIKSLCDIYGPDQIEYYVSSNYELIIKNGVFFTKQQAYITDIEYGKKLVTKELLALNKAISEISIESFATMNDIANRFQKMIDNSDTKEQQLQKYLEMHYQVIFGRKYDKCIAQVKIFHKSVDGNKDERRIDIALHDATRNDWEIIELKKSNDKIIRRIRKIPMFGSAASKGIAQLRYYKNMLLQDKIKNDLKNDYQIDLEVPNYTLVIGNNLNSDVKKCIDQVKDISIKTYNQILEEAKFTFKND